MTEIKYECQVRKGLEAGTVRMYSFVSEEVGSSRSHREQEIAISACEEEQI